MPAKTFRITLKSDLVASLRPGSEGGHECLDYLPGSLLRGTVAGAWKSADPDSFSATLFGGAVRFGNALPSVDGVSSIPVPLSYHRKKGGEKEGAIVNQLQGAPDPDSRQIRSGYLVPLESTDRARLIRPEQVERGKTAINPATRNQAEEGQLFAYQAIREGATFLATITGEQSHLDLAEKILSEKGHRLGRSRTAEFGEVEITTENQAENALLAERAPNSAEIRLLLLSDLCLERNGSAVLQPSEEDFGLKAGEATVDWANTYLASRSYSPWIAYRNGFDDERQVLSKGGVVTLSFPDEESAAKSLPDLRAKLANGIGLHREDGLGQIAVNPAILFMDSIDCSESGASEEDACAETPQSDHPLFIFAKRKADEAAKLMKAENLAKAWRKPLSSLSGAIQRETGSGISSTQWSKIREIAVVTHFQSETFGKHLQAFATEGIRSEQWTTEVPLSGKGRISLLTFILEEELPDEELRPHVAYLAAQLASREIKRS